MIYFVIILFLIAASYLILGIYILLKKQEKAPPILFPAKTFIAAFYIIVSAKIQLTSDYNTIVLLDKITTCCVSVLITMVLHFTMTLAPRRKSGALRLLIYLPLVVIFPMVITQNDFLYEIKKVNDFIVPVERFDSPAFLVFMIHMETYFFAIMGLLLRWINTTGVIKEKKQGKTLLIFIFCFFVAIHISDVLLPALGLFYTPHLDAFLVSIYLAGLFYSISKYSMLTFNINSLFENIIQNMQDMLIILNTELRIIRINRKTRDLLSVRGQELKGLTLSNITAMDESLDSNLHQLVSGEISDIKCRLNYLKGQDRIITDSYISRITDNFGDFAGIMVLSRENLNLRHFKERYRISNRQLEIILLSVNGLTNPEIASRLGLTKRTVESHFFNIYCKMNIYNKVELMKIAVEYKLI